MTDRVSNLLIVGGAAIVVVGVLLRFGLLGWFGHLPGDMRFGSGSARVFIPITSMLLASAVLSVVATLIGKLFGGE